MRPSRQAQCVFLAILLSVGSARPVRAATEVANGSSSSLWPAVGTVYVPSQFETCTGVLISPTWVLTAAHCVSSDAEPSHYRFIVGTDYLCCLDGGYLDVAAVLYDPDYSSSGTIVGDVGLLELAQPLATTPFIVNDGSPPAVASLLYLLGYGVTEISDSNTLKVLGLVQISAYTADTMTLLPDPSIACPGDSGAPAFDYAANGFPIVYSTVSYGDNANCSHVTIEVNMRIDAVTGFIAQHVTDACLRSAPGGPGCDGVFRDGLELPLNP